MAISSKLTDEGGLKVVTASCVVISSKLTKSGFKVVIASCVAISGKLTKEGWLKVVIASCEVISGKLTTEGELTKHASRNTNGRRAENRKENGTVKTIRN